jgi:hypothetical protein
VPNGAGWCKISPLGNKSEKWQQTDVLGNTWATNIVRKELNKGKYEQNIYS